ncbi:MAG: hypothetical protein FD146_1022 [Anaerolineaceae bacterium]|nr:MAG: hypothetical protein FD146_1022 [Anaerolineaceae bacterium]
MKKRLVVLLLVLLLTFTLTGSASAQSNYSFNLTTETVHVYWNGDGTIALDYVFTFANDPGAHVIDYVDVGMPNGDYEWGSISADVNGSPLSISSDFQGDGPYGFAVDMGGYAIQPGQTGSLHVYVGRISSMYYPDSDQPDTYASGEFSPTWFGSAYVHGNTNLTVIFHLPPGVQPEESIYHPARGVWPCDANPQTDHDGEGRIMFTWACASASGSSQYTFGMSVPKQYLPADAIVTAPAFNLDLSGLMDNLSSVCCFGFFFLMFVGAPILSAVNERKRKFQYMPPKISIEGHGIKRGLTAVESAVLMEQPLDKVMTMTLFGVVKKEAATVVTRDPLKLQVAQPLPEGLHEYEKDFLLAFSDPNKLPKAGLQEMTVKLIKSVSEKMKGFSRKETTDYYKSIMERAWQQIEAAGTPEVKSQMYDQALEWTMLDKDYDNRTRRVFTGPVFLPMWWGRYDPGYRPAAGSVKAGAPVSLPSGGRSSVSVPGSAFAASVVTSVQGFSSRVIGDVKTFTSGVTSRTNPLPKSSSAGKGSSGGGRSCACACAGCACACAGGGR